MIIKSTFKYSTSVIIRSNNIVIIHRSIATLRNSSLLSCQIRGTYLMAPLKLTNSKRFMWKKAIDKVVGHAPKVLKALETKTPEVVALAAEAEKPKVLENAKETIVISKYNQVKELVLIADEDRIKHHAATDYFIDKYLPVYQAHNSKITCLIQNPINLAGVFTMSQDKLNNLAQGNDKSLDTMTYQMMDYCFKMYRDPITKESDVTSRIKDLFTYDHTYRYTYPIGCVHGYESNFPTRQHLLTVDTHNFVLKVENLGLPPQLTITQEHITLTKYLEISILLKTHGFVLSKNIEILLVNNNDKTHTTLCTLNANKFGEIMGQLNPDFIGKIPMPSLIAIPGNELSAIPIDVKLHSLPEQSIAFYKSYSTLSPSLQKEVFVHRSKVCAETEIKKLEKKVLPKFVKDNLGDYLNETQGTSKQLKNNKITADQAYFKINAFNQKIICEPHNYHLYPTFIETAIIDKTFNLSWNENKVLYDIVFEDIRKMVQLEAKIIFQNTHKYNSYTFDLFMQRVLQKMELLGPKYSENYYNLRKVLQITYE